MARSDRASADYEQPGRNVADQPDPVTLSTNKARQAENRGHMGTVLVVGTVLAIVAFAIIFLVYFQQPPNT